MTINWKDVAATWESFFTIVGVVVGGVWAYFKFIKDRVYRPRVNLTVEAGHVTINDMRFLACRATIENKGAAKLKLNHDGTELIVRPGTVGTGALRATRWSTYEDDETAVVNAFGRHDWLESTETVSDEVMLRLAVRRQRSYRVELRLVVERPSWRSGNLTIMSPLIVLPSQAWDRTKQGATP